MSVRFKIVATAAVIASAVMITSPAGAAPPQAARVFSASQLSSAKVRLDARLTSPPAGVTSWGVDPATGRVSVSVVAGDAQALAAAKTAIAGSPEASIVTVKERVRPLYALVGGQAINNGSGSCSIGFSGTKGTARYVITAGHCTALGGSWTGYNRVTIGPVASSAYPTDDFGTITVSSSAWSNTGTVQFLGSTSTVPVYGSTEAAVGAGVCRSGITTGWRCGTIQAKNQTVSYGSGKIVYGLTRTNACAEPGDSGGSWITTATGTGGQAQGVTSGGSGNCTSGGTTYFQPLTEALTRTGITLTTSIPTVVLCADPNYGGACTTAFADNPDLRAGAAVGNDTVSSVRAATYRYVALYKDVNYTGTCQVVTTDRSNLAGTTIGADTVSSYRITTTVPAGCTTA